jgi:YD repeat-containing protein
MIRKKLHHYALLLLILAILAISVSPVLAADSGNNVTAAHGDSKDLLPLKGTSPSDDKTLHSPDVTSCSKQHIAGSPSSSPDVPYSIDPVNLATGNYYYGHQDLIIPGPGLPLAINRSYNALDSNNGPFGSGWTFNYNMNLAVITGSGNVAVREEDGKIDVFTLIPGGNYSPPLSDVDKLTKNSDGSYIFEKENQIEYFFTTDGKLINIADNNGNTINLTYTGSNLTQVTDSSGGGLTFTYNAAGRIISIADPSGTTVRYTYDGDDNLVRFSNATGGEISYTYDDYHRMTSITGPDGIRVLNNTYDENGRVIRQSWPPANVNTIDYDADNRMTTLTDPSGGKTVYTFDDRGWELSETDDIGNTISYAYDDNGNRIDTTDTIGNFIRSALNAVGNIIRSVFD